MKKILSIIICLVLICSFSVTAFAADTTATMSGVPSELKKDATATVTVNLSSTPSLSSALVQVTLDDGLELVSGEWKKDGLMKDFTVSNGYGVLALSSAGTLDGTAFSFVIKGKTVSDTAQNITVNFTFKNGSSEVGTATVTKSVKVVCATHNYSAWSKTNDTQHSRTCSACGNVEKANHKWNSGTVTKPADCKETGTKTYTCTEVGCGATKTERIEKTNNHTFSSWSETKAPKCTEKGEETRTCSTCNKKETRDIKATGHTLGNWAETKKADCTNKGQETRSCSKCSHKETRDIKALGHSFSNPTVTKEPTCTEKGVESGKCTRCNKETTNDIPAKGHNIGEFTVTLEPTCTEEGKKEGTCTVCGEKSEQAVEAKGHSYGEAVVTKEATETERGISTKTCSACGDKVEEEIPMLTATENTASNVSSDTAAGDDAKGSNGWIIWFIIGLAVVGGAVAFIVIKNKKPDKID